MDSTMTATPIENRSAIAMPAYGRAFGISACATSGIQGIDVPVRDRHLAATLKGAFPGTSVWRPPSC